MLDLVFSEHGMINLIRDDGHLGNSDHSMIFIESNQLIVKKKESRKRLNYRRGDFAKLRNLLSEYDWRVEMQMRKDRDGNIDIFISNISNQLKETRGLQGVI